ncbi:hypothetical protein BN2497_6241 [Janthinobacterium sp. CG23_2]|nr:hypothetical protein BN2497_6241 [Janthinobacterium sp. CG23_2]CUU29518.1 hypothetical protein BN3177_6241 [Janthinobacterium sp. CG23_2]
MVSGDCFSLAQCALHKPGCCVSGTLPISWQSAIGAGLASTGLDAVV